MSDAEFRGSCLCGAVRWRARGTPEHRLICHCRSCALAAGAPGVPWATWKRSDFSCEGEHASYASSEAVVRTFCVRCGTALTYTHARRPSEIDVATTTLDDLGQYEPEGRIWMEDASAWERRAHELPTWQRGRS